MSTLSPAWVGFGDLSFIVVINVITGSLDYDDAGDVTWYLWPASGTQQQVSIYIHLEESEKTVALNVTVYDNQSRAIPTTQSRYQTSVSSWVHEVTFLATLPITDISDQTVIANMGSGYEQYITGQLLLPTSGPSAPTDVSDVQLPTAPPEPVVVVDGSIPQPPKYPPLPRDPYYDVWEPPAEPEDEPVPDPETPNVGYLQGTVLNNFGNPVVCGLVARDRSDNALAGTATSSAEDGFYSINALTYTEYYVMAFPEERQAMIHDRVYASPAIYTPTSLALAGDYLVENLNKHPRKDALDLTTYWTFTNGLHISENGLKLYLAVTGENAVEVWQYNLSSAWDISSGTFAGYVVIPPFSSSFDSVSGPSISADGSRMLLVNYKDSVIYSFTLETPWDISTAVDDSVSINTSGLQTKINCARFNPAGTRIYCAGYYDKIPYYPLSTPWDLTSAGAAVDDTHSDTTFYIRDFWFSSDGLTIYVLYEYAYDTINSYTLSVAWDTIGVDWGSPDSTHEIGETDYATAIFLNPAESKIYYASRYCFQVYTQTLGTPGTISTADYVQEDSNVFFPDVTKIDNIVFSTDGTRLFILDGARVLEYNLPTAWDVTSIDAAYIAELAVESVLGYSVDSMGFKPDGLHLIFVSSSTERATDVLLGVAWDITSMVSSTFFNIDGVIPTLSSGKFSPDGTKFFWNYYLNSGIQLFTMDPAWDIQSLLMSGSPYQFSEASTQYSFDFHPDGELLYVATYSPHRIRTVELATAFDLSTGVVNEDLDAILIGDFHYGGQFGASDIVWRSDGTRLYTANGTMIVQKDIA